MAKVVVRVRVFPEGIEVDLDSLLGRISEAVKGIAEVLRSAKEPIAFGLNALVIDFAMDEEREGGTYDLEEALSGVEGVGEIDVIGVSRMSTRL